MFLMSMNNRQNFSPPTSEDVDGGQTNNKTVLAQMRKDFFTQEQSSRVGGQEQTQVPKVTNKYLKPENRYVPPQVPAPVVEPVDSQVVQGFVAPQMHHAEVVHVRQDSTSTEASMEASFDTQIQGILEFRLIQFKHFYDTFHFSDVDSNKKKGFLKSLFGKKSSNKRVERQDDDPDLDQGIGEEEFDFEPIVHPPLERKRSMSKPTDLDEILRLQEEEEQRNATNQIFANDPFFNSNDKPELPQRAPTHHSQVNRQT